MSGIKVGDWVTLKEPAQVADIAPSGKVTAINPDGSGWTMYVHVEDLVKVDPPEPDWDDVPRGTRVEVRDFEDAEWHPATYFGYADGDEAPHIAKVFDGYACWRYCRLVGGEHE